MNMMGIATSISLIASSYTSLNAIVNITIEDIINRIVIIAEDNENDLWILYFGFILIKSNLCVLVFDSFLT